MPKLQKADYYFVARCRSGKEIRVPRSMKKKKVATFAQVFSLDEQVDLLAVCEALSVKFVRSQEQDWPEGESVFQILNTMLTWKTAEPLASKLDALNLKTSSALVRHGKTLLLASYYF